MAKKDNNLGLSFVLLDADSIWIVVFADKSFASKADMTSQLEFIISLIDKNNRENTVHYSSFMAKHVTQSVFAAEIFDLVHAVDFASTMRNTVSDTFGQQVPMTV